MNVYGVNIDLKSNSYKTYETFSSSETKKLLKKLLHSDCCKNETFIYIDNRPGHEKVEITDNSKTI